MSELWLYIPCVRIVQIIKEHRQNADRTEKEIFGIFGVINTIKITQGNSQWGSLLWFSLEIESFFCFSFFLLFFFSFFVLLLYIHTQSSFLEAASVRVSLFFFMIFLSSFCIEAPKSRLVRQGLNLSFLNAQVQVE